MVQLNPPVCDNSDDYLLCLTVVKEIQELRFQMIYSEEQQNRLDRKIEELKSWITNDLRALRVIEVGLSSSASLGVYRPEFTA